MGGYILDGILALVILVFAFLELNYSNIVIIVVAALILIHALAHLLGLCNCGCKYSNKMSETKKLVKRKK